jgi:DNA invertase Pin-like site-specific DNA recombinase
MGSSMNQRLNKYLLYARKSTESEDKQIASIDSQITELKKIAERDGLQIIDILSESQSAKAPGRPIFNKMMERIFAGEAQGILCWKLDRLARNPVDGGNIQWTLQKSIIKHIQTFERSYYPSDNVLMMSVEFGMANQFIRDLSISTQRGLRTKAERGWYPTNATLGYICNPLKRKGEKEILIDPERFELVRKMFDLMLTGIHTPPAIMKIANEEWGLRTKLGRKVARSTIYRIFSDPFYYGVYEYPKNSGNWYKGLHQPMITQEEYDKTQIILGKKGKPRPQVHAFAYTGLIRCGECGAMITAENKVKRQKNGNIHHYTYYHCTKRVTPNCSQKTIRQEELEKQIIDILGGIELPPEFCQWALDVLRLENQRESEDRNKILANLQKQYNACIQKIDNLIDMMASGLISEDEFLRRKTEASQEKMRFQELLNDADSRVDSWLDKTETLFDFATSAKEKFKNGSVDDKRVILASLGSNLLLKDGKLSVSLEKPLELLRSASTDVRNILTMLEPLKNRMNKEKFVEQLSQNKGILRWLDQVRTSLMAQMV